MTRTGVTSQAARASTVADGVSLADPKTQPLPTRAAATILICGDFSGERVDWCALCQEHGCEARHLADASQLPAAVAECPRIAAIVLDTTPPGWRDILAQLVRDRWNAPVVLTHGFHSGPPEWEHELLPIASTLLRPLDAGECRQLLSLLESTHQSAVNTLTD